MRPVELVHFAELQICVQLFVVAQDGDDVELARVARYEQVVSNFGELLHQVLVHFVEAERRPRL